MEKAVERKFSLKATRGNDLDGFETVIIQSDMTPLEVYHNLYHYGINEDCEYIETTKTLISQDGVLYLVTQEYEVHGRGARYPHSYTFHEEKVELSDVVLE